MTPPLSAAVGSCIPPAVAPAGSVTPPLDTAATAGKLPSFTTYNLSMNYAFTDALDISLMVNNLFNSMPPHDPTYPGSSGAPYNSAQYSVFGRAVYVEARYDLGK